MGQQRVQPEFLEIRVQVTVTIASFQVNPCKSFETMKINIITIN